MMWRDRPGKTQKSNKSLIIQASGQLPLNRLTHRKLNGSCRGTAKEIRRYEPRLGFAGGRE
jgi:hypothetical protein